MERKKQDVLRKAKVIASLGDHPGLPLLFGVQTSRLPYSIIVQFHDDKEHSLTIDRAVHKKKLNPNEWKGVINRVTEVLDHIHSKGFLHNDLKSNSVVLERRDSNYNARIVDFDMSTTIEGPRKKKKLSKAEQKAFRHAKFLADCTRNGVLCRKPDNCKRPIFPWQNGKLYP